MKTILYLFKQEPLGNVREEEKSGEIQAIVQKQGYKVRSFLLFVISLP